MKQEGLFHSLAFLRGPLALAAVCISAAADPGGTPQNSNFSDASTWTRHVIGSGVKVTPSGNGFQVDYAANTQPSPGTGPGVCAGYSSTFALRGDFTMEIDYALTTWPASSGVRLGLDIWPSINMNRTGQGPDAAERYTFGAGPFVSVPTDDRHGTLRLVRTGETLLGYYRNSTDGSWVLVGSRSGDPVFANDFQVYVCSWTDTSTFGHEAVGIVLSNFVMTADTVLPGPYGVPFWRGARATTSQPQPPLLLKQLDNETRPGQNTGNQNVTSPEGPVWVDSGIRTGPIARPSRSKRLAPATPSKSNFSDPWTWSRYLVGSGVQLTPAGNGFEVDYGAGAQPDAEGFICAGYVSTFALRGDFTMDIDYTLKTWPDSSGIRFGLDVWPSINMIREGQGPNTQEQYTFGSGPFVSIPTGDRHGTLRLVRRGETLLGYYRSSTDGSWVLAGSRSGNPVFLQDFQVSVQSWTGGSDFGRQPVAVTLGNFVMTADTVLPGPYGIPPWKMPPGEQQAMSPVPFQQLDVAPPPLSPRPLRPSRNHWLAPAMLSKSNFSDPSTWSRYLVGSGVQLTPAGNGFEADYAAGAQPDAEGVICAGYVSTFALRGDFTMDIDYTLKTWPDSSGIRLGLDVWPSINMIRVGQGPGTQEQYTFGSGPFVNIPTGDRHGTLRLVRRGETLLGYYRSSADGSWVLAGSRSGNPVFLQDLQVSVQSWSDGSNFAGQPVAVTLGNFVMTADTVLPGPYGIPPWKMPPGEQQVMSAMRFQQLDVAPPPSSRAIRPPVEPAPLQTGILDEDLNLDLNAAIQSYQTLITQFDAQRPLAANAIFRMAECYRRLGRTDEARSQYARILREFSDQAPLVRLSRKYVASLTAPATILSQPGQPVFRGRPPYDLTNADPQAVQQIVATYDLTNADPQDVRQILQDLFQRSRRNPAPNLPVPATPLMPATGLSPATRVPAGLVGLWAGEGNANDSTGANNGVLEGDMTFVAGKVGQAFSFDGTTANVRVPASPSLDVGAGPGMTIEAWIRPADLSTERTVLEWNYGGFGTILNISVTLEGGGVGPGAFTANFKDVNLQHHLINSPAGVLTTNRFQHLAATYDGRNGDAALYLDGAIVAQANLGIFTPRTIGDLYFGVRLEAGAGMRFLGQIDEVGVYNRALSEAEIEAIHAAGGAGKHVVPVGPSVGTATTPRPVVGVSPTPPPQAALVSRWAGEGNANDSQGANNGILEGGVTFVPGHRLRPALSFNGSDADVKVPASPSLDVGLGPGFTIEAWIKPGDLSLARPIVEWNSGGGPVPYGVHFWASEQLPWGTGPGCLYANLVDANGMDHYFSSEAGLLTTRAFQHVALTYARETGEAAMYLNGVPVAHENLGSITPQTSSDLYLGFRPAGQALAYRWLGQMEEVKLYSRALSAAEIPTLAKAQEAHRSSEVERPEARLKPQEKHAHGKVYVIGQVVQTGPLEIPDDEVFTVSKAILKAGGFSDFADKHHVNLITR